MELIEARDEIRRKSEEKAKELQELRAKRVKFKLLKSKEVDDIMQWWIELSTVDQETAHGWQEPPNVILNTRSFNKIQVSSATFQLNNIPPPMIGCFCFQ